ncbi:MAG: DUF4124 domain-containing protein [Rhodocyclaceae bacterium]|jgi:hypothetical protein|nr:DUF4124 domain-containing protein [Rhodocyclaceae bacterium]
MRRWLLLSSLLLPLFATGAQGQGMYKWTDEKGVVHYTDTPPTGKRAEKVRIAPQPPMDAAAPARNRSWQEQQQDANERRHQAEKAEQERQKQAKEAEQKCLKARNALDTLRSERPLYRVGKDGERAYMEDTERQRLIADWQKQSDTHCR